jgi:hypothetical protein
MARSSHVASLGVLWAYPSSMPIADKMAASRAHPLPMWAVDADLLVAGPGNGSGRNR